MSENKQPDRERRFWTWFAAVAACILIIAAYYGGYRDGWRDRNLLQVRKDIEQTNREIDVLLRKLHKTALENTRSAP